MSPRKIGMKKKIYRFFEDQAAKKIFKSLSETWTQEEQ